MKRTHEPAVPAPEPPSNLRVLESFEPQHRPVPPAPPTPVPSVQWTVVDANGSPQGRLATRGEAVRLMSTLAGRMPGALPLRVMDREGHETGDRLA